MFEKEAEEYQTEKRKSFNEHEQLCWGDVYKDWKNGAELGYSKATEWHYIKDKLPPEPVENENGGITPLEYICAYKLNNLYDDFEIGEFLYLGNGEFMGENKNYPIYAWMDSPIIIPVPPKEAE